jgi:hypothetical protein
MSKNIPTNKKLYARVKAEAKRKFDRWPSAYGSAWLVREYKKRGGGYRKAEMGMEVENPYADMYSIGGGIMIDDYEMGYGGMPEYKSGGGIPQRYKNKGFTKVGAKKKSTRPGKKWMVLAKKGDKYKIVHGGDSNMKDFKQHGSAERKKRFWDRMGGRDSAKAKDPFSPLYWHKRFGTWAEGGEMEFEPHMMYDPETGKGYMAEKYEDHLKMNKMGFGHDAPEMGYGGYQYGNGGINNPGFKALPPQVQDKIKANMKMGGIPKAQDGKYLPPAVRDMYPKEDPVYYDGMLAETTVTAPKYEGPQIRRAFPGETDPVNTNFSFVGADKSGGLSALKAIGKGVKGLLGVKNSADDVFKYVNKAHAGKIPGQSVSKTFNYKPGFGNPYESMDVTDDLFKGRSFYGIDYDGQITNGRLGFVRNLGKELDDAKFDANWINTEHLRFHGTPHGRSVVEVAVPGKTHQTQLFYKSSGLAGKAGEGVKGSTQGLWQPYGGHATVLDNDGPIVDWFIKDNGYKTYYDSKSFRDISKRLDDLTKEAGFDMSGQASAYKMGGVKPCYECGGMAAEGVEVQELANVPRKNTPGQMNLAPVFDPKEFPTPMTEEPTSVENPSYGNAFAGKYASGYLFKNGKFNPTLQVQTPGMDEALQFGTMDALAGVSRIAGAMGRNKKESRQLQENKRRQFSDNLYDPISAGAMGSRGDYNLMGEFRPDRVGNWNPYMAESFNTESFYQEGGETEMTDEEIARLRAMGADIEILD